MTPPLPPADPTDLVPAAEPAPIDPSPRPEDDGRLTADQALAELARQPAHVLELEWRHGFVFGGPVESGPGRHAAAVACTTPGCDRQGRLQQVHDDTVQPVHCGGCGAVLHCDHQQAIRRYRDGTIGAPIEHTVTECTVCGSELGRVTRALPPIDLAALPIAVLDQPLDRA